MKHRPRCTAVCLGLLLTAMCRAGAAWALEKAHVHIAAGISPNRLLASKNVKSLQELKGGKQIAVSSFGAALDQMTRELLLKHGIDPQRDVVLRAVEPTPNRLAALMTGAVDAAVLNQMDRLIAKKSAFNELLFYGDHL